MSESANPTVPKVELTEEPYWHRFVCGEAHGRVSAEEARQLQTPPYETRAAHIEVTFESDRAWRIVRVFGTKSLKKAVQAAMVHAFPAPEIRKMGGQDVYGETREITIPKRR